MNIKSIFCRHNWEEYTVKEMTSRYSGRGALLRACSKCQKNETIDKWGISRLSSSGSRVIREELEKIGRWNEYNNGSMGSWYYCEFPSYVSEIFDNSGEDEARRFVRTTFWGLGKYSTIAFGER
jgi:hypothetical protein